MLTIFQSTDAHTLFERFAADVQNTRRDVFDRTTVIVPSMSVRDDLDNRLALRNGISALLDATFFRSFSWALVEKITGFQTIDSHAPLSRTAMHWRMFAVFAGRIGMPAENAMDHWLADMTRAIPAGEARLERLWQLAAQLSGVFVRYLHMRPEWPKQWIAGQGTDLPSLFGREADAILAGQPDWMREHYRRQCAVQQAVWQHCFASAFSARSARLEKFWQILATQHPPLPAPLFVYTLESVDADMHSFLLHLAQYTDIHVYHHAVSEGYFGDMVDDRWLRALIRQGKDAQYDSIHPLLSRFGKQQRDIFLQWIAGAEDNGSRIVHLPAGHPPARTLLATLQAEIRDLNPTLLQHFQPAPRDDSLRIHACHGLMRQLEALRGELARWFAEDPSREPADVLIVLPDPHSAQTLIRTVFPPLGDYDGHILPARITGITPPAAQQLWQAIEGLYTLPATRFEAARVLAWLRREEVCAMLKLTPAAMNRLCDALLEAGYRRGLDETHAAHEDGDPRFTFCYALDRLLTGLWMPGVALVGDTVPYPEDDRDGIAALCRLALTWQENHRNRNRTQSVREWTAHLQQILTQHFPEPGDAKRTIELALRELDGQITTLDEQHPAPPVTLAFVLNDIAARLGAEHTGSEPSGVMTVGRIGAMRSLSYKLIAFIGANLADFPANPPEDRYDLSRLGRKRPGDLRPEHEDPAAFLDILRHAREALWIFYDRHSPGSHETLLPAQPVQELLHYLQEQRIDTRPLLHEHPADPFQPDPVHAPAPLWHQVREHICDNIPATPFVPLTLPETDLSAPIAQTQTLPFAELRRAILKPLDSFLRHHELAGTRHVDADPAVEPLHLDGLEHYTLTAQLIARPDDAALPHLPLLPAGAAGITLKNAVEKSLAARRSRLLRDSGHDTFPVLRERSVTIDAATITLPLPADGAPHLILLPGRKSDKHLLTLWLRHLLWQQAGGQGETWGGFADGIHAFLPVGQPAALLRAWLNVHAASLHQPWLLPVELGMAWDADAPGKALNHWKKTAYPAEAPDTLTFIARGHDPQTVETLILRHGERYAAALYTSLHIHSKT